MWTFRQKIYDLDVESLEPARLMYFLQHSSLRAHRLIVAGSVNEMWILRRWSPK